MSQSLDIQNARIWTAASNRPWAESISIRDGRIVSLDQPAEGGETVDAGQRVIVSGLIDAHVHLLMGGQSLQDLDLSKVTSRDAFESAIATDHAQLPPDAWLIARGWSNENWPSHELPDKSWLAAAGKRPVVCHRMDHHAALVNDAVLQQCDLTTEPAGGIIGRDPDSGDATGIMIEAAAWQLVNPLIPNPAPEQKKEALFAAQAHLHAFGVTTVCSMEYGDDVREVIEPARDALTLRIGIVLLERDLPVDFSFGLSFRGDDRVAVIGYKSFLDGTLGSRSARMLSDYSDDPGNRGMLLELAADGTLSQWAAAVAGRGFQPVMHAIGDEAARVALEIMDELDRGEGDPRPRIEHAQQLALEDLPRFRGRIASMQPLHRADDGRYAERRLDADRLAGSFAFRRLHEAGAVLAFGSDWPIVTCDPMPGIRAAVTGLTLDDEPFRPDQNLTVKETLIAYTRDAARALRFENAIGTLEPGKLGDLVMFDRDPFTADWVNDPPRIILTVAGGEIVYDAT